MKRGQSQPESARARPPSCVLSSAVTSPQGKLSRLRLPRWEALSVRSLAPAHVRANASTSPVVSAGRVPPVDLPLREDLRTRIGWGHVFALEPLREPEVRAALRREADRRGVFLSDDVMDYLLTRFARDLKHLMAQLDRLDEFALANKRAITVPLLRQMLSEESA